MPILLNTYLAFLLYYNILRYIKYSFISCSTWKLCPEGVATLSQHYSQYNEICAIFQLAIFFRHNHNDNLQMVLRLKGRVIVLVCLAFFLYPFLWAWTIVGCLWLSSTRNCVSNAFEESIFSQACEFFLFQKFWFHNKFLFNGRYLKDRDGVWLFGCPSAILGCYGSSIYSSEK